ncbi:acetylhydrolase [Paraglaciecola sp. MB-3u-78]|uniref:alpha/beta hydrolase family protein n=1 Tax=Paraglaciecola sp. MB-3u-78 TaxID=2058332 RepID=UPI000C330DF7|nr:acetylhydrolase [Paraglaciecola sp. MB-3u-78]PKH00289.1 acetylhydrolase [Paraglaciecola sp. MB-3u-78]
MTVFKTGLQQTLRASFLLCCSCLVFSVFAADEAQQLYTNQPDVTPELGKRGNYSVGVRTIQVTNPQQLSAKDYQSLEDRTLTLEVWYPADTKETDIHATYENVTRTHKAFSLQGQSVRNAKTNQKTTYPLVVLSHGYTGYRTIMFYLGEHLASHGYVVVGIDHTDSTTGEVDFENSPFAGFPSTLINRARDQQFVLDYFSSAKSDLAKVVDTDHASVIGYSMGGFGAVNTVGGCYNFNQQGLQAFGFPEPVAKVLVPVFNICNAGQEQVDSRWKAMVAFAPWGQEQNLHKLDAIQVPSLYVSGSLDDVSGYEQGVKKLFEQSAAKDSFMLVYENARHNIAPHPAPEIAYAAEADLGLYYEPSWSSETLNRINQHMTLVFLDCYVKKQTSSCEYLPKRESATQTKQADGKLSDPWPGFADRWGVGMRFVRK